ncbi:hypothetical protein M8C21_017527 [Ambrosia artemisiifolia]|uniref:Protein TILLER ANGLE CONTROL 1 n=1 Tax=Ambrosia artemisiifolia TaxID=4212 RepID=A0AAD5GPX8_AMBAR|nr:hypothetical protein M8C21_017527 [Ambrosia artemisiifolia]
MKIFGWVRRQFQHNAAKKDDDYDKVTLLKNEALAGAYDGWNDGILAIGTLGVDLYHDFKSNDDTFINNQVMFLDDDGDDHDEEIESPLVRKVSNHNVFDHVEKQNLTPCDEVAKLDKHQEDDVNAVKDSTKVKKSGERITLADLLRADPENNLPDELSDSNSNNNSNYGNTESIKSFLVSKVKKKLGKDGSTQPIKKTKQLMRKMLRKKIHPSMIGHTK